MLLIIHYIRSSLTFKSALCLLSLISQLYSFRCLSIQILLLLSLHHIILILRINRFLLGNLLRNNTLFIFLKLFCKFVYINFWNYRIIIFKAFTLPLRTYWQLRVTFFCSLRFETSTWVNFLKIFFYNYKLILFIYNILNNI